MTYAEKYEGARMWVTGVPTNQRKRGGRAVCATTPLPFSQPSTFQMPNYLSVSSIALI
jgi:hypothetical protein